MFLEILILLAILVVVFWDRLYGKRPEKYPPGPMRFPLVGNLPQLGKDGNPLKTVKEWKDKYGDIIGLRFGDFNVVMLHGYDLIKEAYDKPEFSGRPSLGPILVIAGKEKRGLVPSEGPHWSEQRRFALRNLRDFGFGKKSMEASILEDVSDFISTLKAKEGTPISTDRMLSLVVLSSLWSIVAGEKLPINDPRAQELLNTLNAIISSTSITGPAVFMSWVPKLAPKLTGWSSFETAIIQIKAFVTEKITEHKATRDPSNPRDYLDVYLNEIDATKDKNSSFYGRAGEENMLVGALNLFGAGSETTSSTLNWAFYFLAKHPEIQKKMQKELDEIVGKDRYPSIEDKEKLVYTEAIMLETFRKSSLVPFGVFHSAMESVTFHGFEIPKDTAIMANVYDVHHDVKTWGDPEAFRPERFLSSDGKSVVKAGPVIPFLVGKRACLGETLARTSFFLVLTSVVQRFELAFDPDTQIKENEVPSLFRFPPKNKLIFKDRLE